MSFIAVIAVVAAQCRPLWITFQRYNFSVVAVVAAIYSKTVVYGHLLLLPLLLLLLLLRCASLGLRCGSKYCIEAVSLGLRQPCLLHFPCEAHGLVLLCAFCSRTARVQ